MSLTRRGALGAAFSALVLSACASTPAVPDTTIYLVRHAEKAAGEDPSLTVVGTARADILSQELADADLTGIWSTDTNRTRETAKPTSNRTRLPIQIYDARAQAAFAQRLKATPGTFLVVGHSNTIPQLVDLLGGKAGAPIDEATEYDRLYIVTIRKGRTRSELRRYGAQ